MAKSKPTSNPSNRTSRIEVQKTYKMYIGGSFPRTESGRFYAPEVKGKPLGNICLASRKDLRNAVVAARSAQSSWADRTAYNRSQILYRIAEMLEGRAEQFELELIKQGLTASQAKKETELSIDRLIYYAGWCDKFQQIFSSVNPVATPHFNFSVLEPTGVVFVFSSEFSPLLGLASLIAPIIVAGNSCVVLASTSRPLSAITLAEVLSTSDLPGGVVNLLTGNATELAAHAAKHLDINSVVIDSKSTVDPVAIEKQAACNVKRIVRVEFDWTKAESENPYLIEKFCEVKTTWHPIERITQSGSKY